MTVHRSQELDDLPVDLEDLDDQALLVLVRTGTAAAFEVLFDRYRYSALRLARHLGQQEESDDVMSESFAQILDLLQRGKGPTTSFRAYLFTTVRNESARRAKARQRVTPTDDVSTVDRPVPFGDGRLDDFERDTIRSALEELPARWQTVLWHLDVEGRKPHELAELLDMSPNGVSALVYRARAGLRTAYLRRHVRGDSVAPACSAVRDAMTPVLRRTGGTREQQIVHQHLPTCDACMTVWLELENVNRGIPHGSARG